MAFRAQISVFLVTLLMSVDANAQQVGLGKEILGCWRIDEAVNSGYAQKRGGFALCFGDNGQMTGTLVNQGEALINSGTYRVNDQVLMIFGSGEGWPSGSRTSCAVALNDGGEELVLEDCGFRGIWKRMCRRVIFDSDVHRCTK